MNPWLVLPMKSLREGKSRLSSVLDSRQRNELLEHLLQRVLARAAQFPGLGQTLLVSGCAQTRARASGFGARTLEETPGAGLNGALRQAHLELRRVDASRMLVVPCDLALLEADDLRRLAGGAAARRIAIAPDESGQGTNGLCFDAALEFDFSFGPHSFARHVEQIRRAGLQHATVHTPGLAFDLDLPQQLGRIDWLCQPASSPR
jgi:2-phospho-L-lactate/phosphoenolpyruvate guanylyltransferase